MAARPELDEPTPCCTLNGGVYRDCYDVRTAAEVAATCGQPHQVIPLRREFFEDFATFAERTVYLTDGCLDITGAQSCTSASAPETSRLSGSPELTAAKSSEAHGPSRVDCRQTELFTGDLLQHCRTALTTFDEFRAPNQVTFAAMQEIPWHLYGRLAVAQSQLVVRSPYMDNELVALAYTAPPALRKPGELSLRLITRLNPGLHRIATDMGLVGGRTFSLLSPSYTGTPFQGEWYSNFGMPDGSDRSTVAC